MWNNVNKTDLSNLFAFYQLFDYIVYFSIYEYLCKNYIGYGISWLSITAKINLPPLNSILPFTDEWEVISAVPVKIPAASFVFL